MKQQDKAKSGSACGNPDCKRPMPQAHGSRVYCSTSCRAHAIYLRRSAGQGRQRAMESGVPNGRVCTNPDCSQVLRGAQRLFCSENCRSHVNNFYRSKLRKGK